MTILPLRRLFIERQVQPEMLNFVSTEEVVALFTMYVSICPNLCRLLTPSPSYFDSINVRYTCISDTLWMAN